ncbi:MAG: tetratricopeptide repeat protein [Pseudohongiellaceae bacterium]
MLAITALTSLAGACSSTGMLPEPTDTPAPQDTPPLAEEARADVDTTRLTPEPERYGNFTREQLTALILGELGGQRGHMDDAAERYYHLALDTRDLAIVRRAAEYNAAAGNNQRTLTLTDQWIELAPDDEAPYLMRSYHRLQNNDFLAAMDDMASVLELGGAADFTALSARSPGLDDATRRQIRERLKALREQHPGEPSLHYALAQMLDQAGDPEAAHAVLDEARERFGETPRLLIVEAQRLQNLQQQGRALELLQQGVERFPGHRLLRHNLARILLQADELQRAREQFTELLRRSPGDLESLYSLALINVELAADREAGRQLQALVSAGYRSNEALYYLGMLAERNRAPEQALQWYSGIERGANVFLAGQRQALRLLTGRGEHDEARQWSQRVSDRHPDMTALMNTLEAEALLNAGEQARAATLLDEALEQFPDNVDLLFARTTLNEQRDRPEAVARDLRRILRLEPDNVRALNHLGYSLTVHTDRYEEALELIGEAIELEPDDPAIIDSLGWVQFKLGQLDDALHNLERAYAMFPNHEVAAHLGEVLWVRGERERAMTIWEEGLDEEPDSEYINDAMERLVHQ